VVLTWVYRNTGRSILLVAALHTAFNLASATEAAGFVVGAVAGVGVTFGGEHPAGRAGPPGFGERVTGIEPAWPASKAGRCRHVCADQRSVLVVQAARVTTM
jgi:hypothetical protein